MDLPDDMPDELKKMLKAMAQGNAKIAGITIGGGKSDCDKCDDRDCAGHTSNSIIAHYGVKDSDFEKWTKEITADMITNNNKNSVLDKWFPKLDNNERVKVLAYVRATEVMKTVRF